MRIVVWVIVAACSGKSAPPEAPANEKPPLEKKAPASETVDPSGFKKDCKTVADCKIVKSDPCNHCSCASVAIAAGEAARFAEAAQAITCGPREPIRCGECRGFVADCAAGQCIAKPEP